MKEEQSPTAAFPLSEKHFPPTKYSEINDCDGTSDELFLYKQVPTDSLFSFTKLKNNAQLQKHLFPWTSLIEQLPLMTMLFHFQKEMWWQRARSMRRLIRISQQLLWNGNQSSPVMITVIIISVGHNFIQGFSRLVFLFPQNPGKPGISKRTSQSFACRLFLLNLHPSPFYTHFQIGFCHCSKSTCLPYVRRSRVMSPVVLLLWSWTTAVVRCGALPSFPLHFEEQGTTPPTWHLCLFLSLSLCSSTKIQFYQMIPLGGGHDSPLLH